MGDVGMNMIGIGYTPENTSASNGKSGSSLKSFTDCLHSKYRAIFVSDE